MVNLPVVRDKVQKIVNENIDAAFKQVGFKALLTQVWPVMSEPKPLEKDVWLLLQPEKIGLTDIVGTGRYLKTNLSLTARPQIVTGDKPRVVMPVMPVPQRLITSGDGFYVALRGDIRFRHC
jgi:hypothetical protein